MNVMEAGVHLDDRCLHVIVSTLALLLLAGSPAAAQPVAGPYHQPIRPVVQWTFQTDGIFTNPVVGTDGTIYVGSYDGYLYALSPDGTIKWRYEIGCCIGIDSSPVLVNDGTIYVSVDDLYAISPSGTLKWTYEMSGDVYASPAIGTEGTIYVGSFDDGVLYALRPEGSLKWTYSVVGNIGSAPALGADGTIYVQGGAYEGEGGVNLYAISSEGTLKWRYPLDVESKTTPAVGPRGTIYVGAVSGLYAIRPNGRLQWKYDDVTPGYTGAAVISPTVGPNGTIYVSGRRWLQAFYPNGELKWTYEAGKLSSFSSAPVVGAGGIIYVTASTSIGFNSYTHLYAIGPEGSLRWKLTVKGDSFLLAPVLGPGGRLYIGTTKYLYAIGSATVSVARPGGAIPDAYELHANYPNPFNPATTISYALPEAQRVRLEVFDLLGRRVRVLVDGWQTAGRHEVRFDGSALPSGIYIYRLQAGPYRETRRMVLIK